MTQSKKYDVRYVYRWAKHYLWCSTRRTAYPSKHYTLSAFSGQADSLTAREIFRLTAQQPDSPAESLADRILVTLGFLSCVALVTFMG